MFKQMFIVFIVVLIALAIGAAFTKVMERWDRHEETKYEQEERMRPTIGLPQGVAIEIGRVDLNTVARTITLSLHIKLGDTYYYTELTLPTREMEYNGAD